jgi:hypothetical protein
MELRYSMNRQKALWWAGAGVVSWLAYRLYRASTAFSFTGKTVLITRGLGLVMVQQLARQGPTLLPAPGMADGVHRTRRPRKQ